MLRKYYIFDRQGYLRGAIRAPNNYVAKAELRSLPIYTEIGYSAIGHIRFNIGTKEKIILKKQLAKWGER